MGKRLIKSESGMAMVAVMMALLVLSILGTAAVTMASSNVKVGLEEREFQAAYYIAEAGATYYMEDLRSDILEAYNNNPDNEDGFFNQLVNSRLADTMVLGASTFELEYGSHPEAEIKLTQLNEGNRRKYILESTGTVDGISRTVTIPLTLQWKKQSSSRLGTDYAVFTYGHMNAGGGTINGPIASLGNLKLGGDGGDEGDGYIQLNGSAYSKGDLEFNNGVASNFDEDSDDLLYSQGNMKITGGTVNIPSYSNGTFSMSNGTINYGEKYASFSEQNMEVTGGTINGPVLTKGTFKIMGGTVKSNKDFSVFADKKIKLGGGNINGPIGVNSTATDAISTTGEGWPSIGDYYLRSDGDIVKHSNHEWWNPDGAKKKLTSAVSLPELPEFPDLPEEPTVDEIPDFPDFPEIEYCEVEGSFTIVSTTSNEDRIKTLTNPITYIPQIKVTGGSHLTIKYHDGDIL
ncbi:MAG: hypothetical protein GX995_10980, partial [Clostridiales bacterium]|nr:hypothetical protein [Clostridiales bacterium]